MALCFNCFHQHDPESGVCPHCGFDLEQQCKDYPIALSAGTMLNNRYYVGRVLGQGGFGITYVALDTNLNAKVAIKEFMPSELATRLDGKTVSVYAGDKSQEFDYGEERFLEEARTLAQFIGNPNIAGVSNYFTENDTSYFVMDYIEGISFKAYIAQQGGTVPLQDALNVMIPVLTALGAVHKAGFIHRDVTPDNIFITKDGGVKLLDFGSARYSVGDRSKSLDVILKVGYAPKEQYIRRGRQGPFTDVYSCAACLYACLTGYLPPESLERMEDDTLAPVSQVLPEIPEYINNAILKGLAVNAEDRFQSAQEFLQAIETQTVVQVPTKEAPVPPKKKSPAVLIAAIAAVAVVACVGMFVFGGGSSESVEMPSTSNLSTSSETVALSGKMVTILDQTVDENITEFEYYGSVGNAEFAEICSLPYLKQIHLADADLSQLSDISPVANLTELEYINFGYSENHYNAIESYAPLQNLTKLTDLFLGTGYATDVEYLANLTNLEELCICGYGTKDLSWVSSLVNLKELQLRDSDALETLHGLENLTKLEYLNIRTATNLATLDGLGDKPALTELEIGDSCLKDISALSNAQLLERINFYGSDALQVETLASISALTNLQELSICMETPILDLSPLSHATELRKIYIYNKTAVIESVDLTPLAGLTNLTELILSRGASDLTPLANLKNLLTLEIYSGPNPSDNVVEFSSLEPLVGLTNLQSLTLSSENINTLEPLSSLSSLVSLTLSNGTYDDVSPLAGLSNLRSVSIRIYNNITLANKDMLSFVPSLEIYDAST